MHLWCTPCAQGCYLKFWLHCTSYGVYISQLIRFARVCSHVANFRKIILRYKRIGYNINIMRQSACLVFNPTTVNSFVSLFDCMPVGRVSLSDGPNLKLFIFVVRGRSFFVCCLAHRGSTVGFLLLQCSSGVVRHPMYLQVSVATLCFCQVLIFVSSWYLSVIYLFPVMILDGLENLHAD